MRAGVRHDYIRAAPQPWAHHIHARHVDRQMAHAVQVLRARTPSFATSAGATTGWSSARSRQGSMRKMPCACTRPYPLLRVLCGGASNRSSDSSTNNLAPACTGHPQRPGGQVGEEGAGEGYEAQLPAAGAQTRGRPCVGHHAWLALSTLCRRHQLAWLPGHPCGPSPTAAQ